MSPDHTSPSHTSPQTYLRLALSLGTLFLIGGFFLISGDISSFRLSDILLILALISFPILIILYRRKMDTPEKLAERVRVIDAAARRLGLDVPNREPPSGLGKIIQYNTGVIMSGHKNGRMITVLKNVQHNQGVAGPHLDWAIRVFCNPTQEDETGFFIKPLFTLIHSKVMLFNKSKEPLLKEYALYGNESIARIALTGSAKAMLASLTTRFTSTFTVKAFPTWKHTIKSVSKEVTQKEVRMVEMSVLLPTIETPTRPEREKTDDLVAAVEACIEIAKGLEQV